MKKQNLLFIAATLIFAVAICCAPLRAQNAAGEPAPASEAVAAPSSGGGILVMPVLVTAFGKKDKFYGSNQDISRALHQFFTFALTVMTSKEVKRANLDELQKAFPQNKVFVNTGAASLNSKVDKAQLDAAAKAYNVNLVVCLENSKATVLVEGRNWTLSTTLKYVVYNAADGSLSDEKTYSQEERFAFDSEKDQNKARGGTLITFSGSPVKVSEIDGDPMKFGGTVGGYPFVAIARKMAADIAYY